MTDEYTVCAAAFFRNEGKTVITESEFTMVMSMDLHWMPFGKAKLLLAELLSRKILVKNGEFLIIKEDEVSAGELLDMGAWDVFSFGPALITDGEIAVEEGEEVGKAMQSNPRTAIGVIDELHYVFLVADGRTADNTGLTLRELADFMKELGVETAYNLDGGGSSAMVFQGELVNKPTTGGRKIGERSVSDIVYIR